MRAAWIGSLWVALGLAGCASDGLSSGERAALGRIGVVPARYFPDARFEVPAGKGTGAAEGGLLGGLRGVDRCTSYFASKSLFALCSMVVAPVTAATGAVTGAIRAPSNRAVAAKQQLIDAHLESVDYQRALRDKVVTKLRRRAPGNPAAALDELGPESELQDVNYGARLPGEFATAFEVAVTSIRAAVTEARDNDPAGRPFTFEIAAQAKLVRRADGALLLRREYRSVSGGRPFWDYAEDDGTLARIAIHVALDQIASLMLHDLFPAVDTRVRAKAVPGGNY